MTKRTIVIIGAGPRGLAIALRASMYNNYRIYIIDKKPISTWLFPNMLPDIEMRSPITFDLTTFYSDLKSYSLSTYLKESTNATSQLEVESSDKYCSRKDFLNYLNYIIDNLKKRNVIFIPRNVCDINESDLSCEDGFNIRYDYLIIATGRRTQYYKCPSYLRGKTISYINCLPMCSWFNKDINVVGSGQQSAEIVEFLARQKANVTWIQKHTPIISQYPVPSWTEWNNMTALGNYYTRTYDKFGYLEKVKKWGPSITPYIKEKLERLKYKVIIAKDTNEINMKNDFILATGFKNDIELLDLNFEIDRDNTNPYLPNIKKSFQSSSHPYIYFTGLLASFFDGPRQGSLISSAYTAHIILESINNG